MTTIRLRNHDAQSRVTELYAEVGDWLCVAGFVATAVAVTMAPFILF
jgi:hypothetical protein